MSTSRVRIVNNGDLKTADVSNCRDDPQNEIDTIVVEHESAAPSFSVSNASASGFSPWTRRNSVSLPAGLNAIMSEPPEYEPQVR